MGEGNGGELSVGQRLFRIEGRLDSIETHLEERINRHKERNEAAIAELAKQVVNDVGMRVAALEKHDAAEAAVASYRKWLIGGVLTMVGLGIAILGLLIQVLGKVGS